MMKSCSYMHHTSTNVCCIFQNNFILMSTDSQNLEKIIINYLRVANGCQHISVNNQLENKTFRKIVLMDIFILRIICFLCLSVYRQLFKFNVFMIRSQISTCTVFLQMQFARKDICIFYKFYYQRKRFNLLDRIFSIAGVLNLIQY